MGEIPSKGLSKTGKCTVLNMGLIEGVKVVIFEINQHGMILHTKR